MITASIFYRIVANPEWMLGSFCLVVTIWLVLRGPKVVSNLIKLRRRRQEIAQQREEFLSHANKFDRIKVEKESAGRDIQAGEGASTNVANLRKNWRWQLMGFAFVALGVWSWLTPDALDGYQFVGRHRGIGMIVQLLWGWPIGTAGLVFGLLCVLGSFMTIDE